MLEDKILFFVRTNFLNAVDHKFLDIKFEDVKFDCKLHEDEKVYYFEMIITHNKKDFRHTFLIGTDLSEEDLMRTVAGTTLQALNIIEGTIKGAQNIIRVVK
jgi:hypothetical protein